jgi:hypothetical protein
MAVARGKAARMGEASQGDAMSRQGRGHGRVEAELAKARPSKAEQGRGKDELRQRQCGIKAELGPRQGRARPLQGRARSRQSRARPS